MVPKAHSLWPARSVRSGRRLESISSANPMSEFIWIVDDDVSVRNSIEQHLDSDGLNAQCFQDGDEAFLALVRQALVSTS